MSEFCHFADHEIRELLGSITHDFRNPLSAVISNLEYVRQIAVEHGLPPDLLQAIQDSAAGCDVLRLIVSNLDVLAKGSHLGRSLQETTLRELIESVVQRMAARAIEAGVTIELEPGHAAARTMLDPWLFELALENLLTNSLHYAPEGTTVRIMVATHSDRLDVEVRDSGPPIPKELRELALSPKGNTHAGRRDQTRYGRGVALLAAHAAATATHAVLRLGSDGETNLMTLSLATL